MSLKSIFSLVLINDGKRYNTGDISEKTGLQKQPDGSWAPQKNKGGAPTASGMSKKVINAENGKGYKVVEKTPKEEKEMWSKVAEKLSDEKLQKAIKNREGKKLNPVEKIKLEAIKEELANRTSSAQEELIKLEKERRSYGDDSKNDYAGHKIRLKQADLLNKAGFKDRKEFDKFYENQNKTTDSACRITADTKIKLNQIKKKV